MILELEKNIELIKYRPSEKKSHTVVFNTAMIVCKVLKWNHWQTILNFLKLSCNTFLACSDIAHRRTTTTSSSTLVAST